MSNAIPFDFEMPVSFFEKADAPEGKQRRIGGMASVETDDKQKEQLLARGLDFSEAISDGWFNDNHSKKTEGILGYPETAKLFAKGEQLPDGKVAPAAGQWVEGYLLDDYPPADRIWNLGKSLAKTHRRLGFSVEGKILKKAGLNKSGSRIIASAKVRNIAITNCPVNSLARMEILAKSLQAVQDSDDSDDMATISKRVEAIEKALTMGEATPGVAPVGSRTGEGAATILAKESLEKKSKCDKSCQCPKCKKLTKAEAIAWVLNRLPNATTAWAERFVSTALALKRQDA